MKFTYQNMFTEILNFLFFSKYWISLQEHCDTKVEFYNKVKALKPSNLEEVIDISDRREAT